LVASGAEAQRNVEQGGVRVDGDKIEDKALQLSAGTYVLQVGKRKFARVTIS
jgi:tyrosyl-tRNA synthetase